MSRIIGDILPMLVGIDPPGDPEQVGQPVLGQVGPVVHEGQEDPVPQV